MTTDAELWSLYGDLAATDPSPSEEERFRKIQRYQKAHSCVAQKPGAEKQADKARQMLEIAVKVRRQPSILFSWAFRWFIVALVF